MTDKPVEVGDAAPDFALKDQNGQEHKLSALRGKQVVLSFHPQAWTRVCTIQMQDLEKHKADMDGLGAVALGISVDSQPCKKAWAQSIGVSETAASVRLLAPRRSRHSLWRLLRRLRVQQARRVHRGRGRGSSPSRRSTPPSRCPISWRFWRTWKRTPPIIRLKYPVIEEDRIHGLTSASHIGHADWKTEKHVPVIEAPAMVEGRAKPSKSR